MTVGNVPDGASLSAGTDNGDGTWTLAPDDLDGLSLNPPSNYSGSFDIEITAITTDDGGDQASTTSSFTVQVAGVADTPGLTVSDASGFGSEEIPLDITATQFDMDGSETMVITVRGLPEGAGLSAGTENPDGSWTVNPDELQGLRVVNTPSQGGVFEIEITATVTESDGDVAESSMTSTMQIFPLVESSDAGADDSEKLSDPDQLAELAWDDDIELGVIDTVSEIDQTLEDIEGQVDRLDLPSTDPDAPRESLAYTQIAEVPPLDAADGVDDSPLPPPTSPIFEFTHDEGATKAEINDAGRLTVPTAEAGGTAQSETQDAAETARTQFGRSFAFLWGLLRSVGGRPIEGKAGAQNGPSKN